MSSSLKTRECGEKSLSSIDRAKKFPDCQDSYAVVRGTFKAGIGGHNDMASGELHDIAECSVR